MMQKDLINKVETLLLQEGEIIVFTYNDLEMNRNSVKELINTLRETTGQKVIAIPSRYEVNLMKVIRHEA